MIPGRTPKPPAGCACQGSVTPGRMAAFAADSFPFRSMATGKNTKKNTDVPGTTPEGTAAPAAAPAAEKKGPVKSFREGDVSVSIWAREYSGRVYHSCSFERSYKDATGQWRYTRYFGLDDLGLLVALAQRASEYLHGLSDQPVK